METIIKPMRLSAPAVLLTAILIAAPTHAMFNHMNKAFRTAVMNRGFSTQPSMLASIHNGRRPLTTLGALIGIGSTGYAVQQASKQQQQATPKKHYDCQSDIAKATFNALKWEDTPAVSKAWMNERAKIFHYCNKHKRLSPESLYIDNMLSARFYTQANYEWSVIYPNNDAKLRKIIRNTNLWEETSKQLRKDADAIQDHYRRIDEMMPFWPA